MLRRRPRTDYGWFESVYTKADGSHKDGVLYLLHFELPVNGHKHYVGWTRSLTGRLRTHLAGEGAVTTKAAVEKGIPFVLAKAWPGTHLDERRLLGRKDQLAALCPICTSWREGKRKQSRERYESGLYAMWDLADA